MSEKAAAAAYRLHHLSMRYAGAFVELLYGREIAFLPTGHPGLRETRDFIDLILLTRAELNGVSQLLVEAGLVSEARLAEIMTEQYEWLTAQKEHFLGVRSTDAGLVIDVAARDGRSDA